MQSVNTRLKIKFKCINVDGIFNKKIKPLIFRKHCSVVFINFYEI